MTSPYEGISEAEWGGVTTKLIAEHPLDTTDLLSAAQSAWETLWQTTVGTGDVAVNLADLRVPATIVGYFFEVLLARELERRHPDCWRGSRSKEEKDLVYVPDASYSIEIKASGQAGFKIFGNRSYGQDVENSSLAKKEKSGFYITVNFYEQTLTLIRFGWIDASDWDAQEAPTGQMAGLKQAVYDGKLLPIPGSYRQQAPICLLRGVGEATASKFAEHEIRSVGDLLAHTGDLPKRLERIKQENQQFLVGCVDP